MSIDEVRELKQKAEEEIIECLNNLQSLTDCNLKEIFIKREEVFNW